MTTALPTRRNGCPVFDQATLASGLSHAMNYTVGARVLAGKGLTVIANKGNPAGQAILARFFPSGITPLGVPGRRRRLEQSSLGNFYVPDVSENT